MNKLLSLQHFMASTIPNHLEDNALNVLWGRGGGQLVSWEQKIQEVNNQAYRISASIFGQVKLKRQFLNISNERFLILINFCVLLIPKLIFQRVLLKRDFLVINQTRQNCHPSKLDLVAKCFATNV